MTIDINCDVGEGIANEHLLMPYISSCNIACGGHFGDKNSIDKTIELAIKNNVLIGAHPSYPDTINFGRKRMAISNEELNDSISNQLDLFLERLAVFNQKMHHIKPHGALYNLIAVDEKAALNFIKVIKKYADSVFLYVPYNSVIAHLAKQNNIAIKYEAFADRAYNDDVTLVSRLHKNALITNAVAVYNHVYSMVKENKVQTVTGANKKLEASTFCIHGDQGASLVILKFLHKQLPLKGIYIGS